ncbi:hypothetical protein [Sphingomonas sp. BAUL-RG-20F-R05-02]|uniref:hypothetical protein n=1 Tax=Sphingomonas sp. BAUL-RG-20F-R05-02 TaxID=2914830 RepID=UPI001F58A249|nr:hypothetical protein [Sphingomonas sp. BAUL-RG-20F-R05-02]
MNIVDLAAPATLFEASDPLDEQLNGQAVQQGTVQEVVLTAMEFADCRLKTAKIVTADQHELRAGEIEMIYMERIAD